MQLRLRIAVVGSIAVMVASTGIIGAGPAAADSFNDAAMSVTPLNGGLAYAYVAPPDEYEFVQMESTHASPWDVPPSAGQISYYHSSPLECMTVDAGDADFVYLTPCTGKASEEWTTVVVVLVTSLGDIYTYEFVSKYNGDCLNDDYFAGYLNVAPCDGGRDPGQDQEFSVIS